jgi:acyl-homoserine-lactone acylase
VRIRAFFAALAIACPLATAPARASGPTDLRAAALRTEIVRDDWGIAHVHGETDADAVFGTAYAQAEDDFARVESNYIDALGRRSETAGEGEIYRDLRMKLFVDPVDLRAAYRTSPPWLRALMDAWSSGLNYYLVTHPSVRPRVIAHFEPWMALSFTEGSIGGDVESVSIERLRAFYGGVSDVRAAVRPGEPANLAEPQGSNGIAIAPANTVDHHALLLINPHTSFFFRSELQMTSDAGLDAYGAVTWGQFFVYQGFNAHAGWMHTSTTAHIVDEFAETIVRRGDRFFYRYGAALEPVVASGIVVPFRRADGRMSAKTFTVYRTRHGPIVREADGQWIAASLMVRPVQALEQSYLRTKAGDYASFRAVAALRANSSNDTIFADSRGEIAYLHPQYIPRRNDRFDYREPVDGADPATSYRGIHTLDEEPHVVDPPSGWLFNTNDGPWNAAGAGTLDRSRFPRYMDTVGENLRGRHVATLLTGRTDFTLETLRAAAYDPYLPFFAELVPSLVTAWDGLARDDPLEMRLRASIELMRAWDFRWSSSSVETTLAVTWAEELANATKIDPNPHGEPMGAMLAASPRVKLDAFAAAIRRVGDADGTVRTPWGDVNRFQRVDDAIAQQFSDRAPSIPVPFVSGNWGSLASFGTVTQARSTRRYGTNGNSFVAVVEFGDRVRALAITAGGESGDPASPHFDDQARRYAAGALREVYFYPEQLARHTERSYHPGDRQASSAPVADLRS